MVISFEENLGVRCGQVASVLHEDIPSGYGIRSAIATLETKLGHHMDLHGNQQPSHILMILPYQIANILTGMHNPPISSLECMNLLKEETVDGDAQ